MSTLGNKQELMAELCHQINSPLAAMRNAVYLAATRTQDPTLLHYLALADDEITAIAMILRETRKVVDSMGRQVSACHLADCPLVTQAKAKAACAVPTNGQAAA